MLLSHWPQYARRSFAQVDTSLWSLSYQRQGNAQPAIYLSALDPASENLLIIHLDDELLPLIDSAVVIEFFVQMFTTFGSSITSPVSSPSELRVPVFSSM